MFDAMNEKSGLIEKCRICGSSTLKEILELGDLYLSSFTKVPFKTKKFPICLVLCPNCFLVQLKHTTPQKYLYTENYGYRSGINSTMKDHLQGIVEEAMLVLGKKPSRIIDVGANDGTLLSFYPKGFEKIAFEPVKKLAKLCTKFADKVFNTFFAASPYLKIYKEKKADIITVISCFYDMEDPNQFINDISKTLSKDGILVIQQNYLVGMLKKLAFDNIVHEHLEYYSLLSLENLLNRHNLEVFDVSENDLNGGSFRTYITWKDSRLISKKVFDMKKSEKKLKLNKIATYSEFAKKIKANKSELSRFLKSEVNKLDLDYIKVYNSRMFIQKIE
jgi:hypothetical protein